MELSAPKRDKYLWLCLLMSLLIALLAIMPAVIDGGGALTVTLDYNNQQIPYSEAARSVIKDSAGGQWAWGTDLGTSAVTAFGFGLLGSPFFLLTLPFPEGSFPYLAGYIYVLKYAAAACFAYLYLRFFIKDRKYAVLAALLYAFSGFQSVNHMFYNFHDSVAFFPLLLLGLELGMEREHSRAGFVFAVFLNCITNYFFFVEEVVFLVIYFLFRFVGRPLGELVRSAFVCVLCGVAGVVMAAGIFLPNLLYLMGNARNEAFLYSEYLCYGAEGFLYILKGMLLPGDLMAGGCAVSSDYSSTGCYLPLVGMPLALAYIRGEKSWLRSLLILLLVISFSPLFQSVFVLFTLIYQRWWFMLCLMLALAAAFVMEAPEKYRIRSSALIFLVLLAAFAFIVGVLPWNVGYPTLVSNMPRFLLLLAISAAGAAVLFLPGILGKYRVLALLTALACAVTTFVPLFWYRSTADSEKVLEDASLSFVLPELDTQYRYLSGENLHMITGNVGGIASFGSSFENSSYRFDILFDNYSKNKTLLRLSTPGVPELLGGRYTVQSAGELAGVESAVENLTLNGCDYVITESPACPIGFASDCFLRESELGSVEKERRALLLMNGVCVPDDYKLSGFEQLDISAPFEIEGSIERTQSEKVSDFTRDTTGFACSCNYGENKLVWFSVPYSSGWTALIDGVKAEIIDSAGMMALAVPAGVHRLVFTYETPLLKQGLILSAVGIPCLIVFAVSEARKRKKDPAD